MRVEVKEIVHAVSAARKKAEELPEMEELKTLLKGMKSKAIEAIPKLKLIWKILTTKNRIELDLNNF
jgi:L-lactate utilization protein LutB